MIFSPKFSQFTYLHCINNQKISKFNSNFDIQVQYIMVGYRIKQFTKIRKMMFWMGTYKAAYYISLKVHKIKSY